MNEGIQPWPETTERGLRRAADANGPVLLGAAGEVGDDLSAIAIFLESYARRSPHTVRSYEKECRRFLLWLKATRPTGPSLLPAVTVQDIHDYLDFLGNPQPFAAAFLRSHGWEHAPFRKPLSGQSLRHCITVLHKLFAALRELRAAGGLPYCLFNPVVLARRGMAGNSQDAEIEEALTPEELAAVLAAIEALPRGNARELKHYHRARWLMQLLYRAFLRRDEAARLTMGAFEPSADGWNIRLVGKGAKKARIVATDKLVAELEIYRVSLGLPALPAPGEARPAILSLTGQVLGQDKGVSAQAIYLICKVLFGLAAARLAGTDPRSASRLHLATPHWMRHTGVTHALESGANPRYVQAQARHSSLLVTARYDHKARQAWRRDLERM